MNTLFLMLTLAGTPAQFQYQTPVCFGWRAETDRRLWRLERDDRLERRGGRGGEDTIGIEQLLILRQMADRMGNPVPTQPIFLPGQAPPQINVLPAQPPMFGGPQFGPQIGNQLPAGPEFQPPMVGNQLPGTQIFQLPQSPILVAPPSPILVPPPAGQLSFPSQGPPAVSPYASRGLPPGAMAGGSGGRPIGYMTYSQWGYYGPAGSWR